MLMKQDRFFAYGGAERMPHRERDASRTAGELLLRFGITPHLCGFEPLCEGVRIVAEREREDERPPLSELQPAVGRLLGAVIAFSGVAALAIPTGIITSGIMEHVGRRDVAAEAKARSSKDKEDDQELREQRERFAALDAKLDKLLEQMAKRD